MLDVSISIKKLHPLLAAEVTGINLHKPLDPHTIDEFDAAWQEYGVLVFPQQAITDEQQVDFSRNFGELEIFPQANNRSSQIPEIFRVTNVGDDDKIRPVETPEAKYSTLIWEWHSDSSYRQVPSKGAILHAMEVVKRGGDTLFSNMYAAYDQMPSELRNRITGLKARHSFPYSRRLRSLPPMHPDEAAKVPSVDHPLVRHHRDGRRSLYVSATYMERIIGVSEEKSKQLIDDLMAWATQDRFVYRHRWQPHDVLMWEQSLDDTCRSTFRPWERATGHAPHNHCRDRAGERIMW